MHLHLTVLSADTSFCNNKVKRPSGRPVTSVNTGNTSGGAVAAQYETVITLVLRPTYNIYLRDESVCLSLALEFARAIQSLCVCFVCWIHTGFMETLYNKV